MKRGTVPLLLGTVLFAVVTVAITLYAGTLTGRWGTFRGMDEARASLKLLPMEIGKWKAEEERQIGEQAVAMLQIQDSYIFRSYKNSDTQDTIHLTLMVGPAGRITVHTPDICFGGRNYEKESQRTRVPISVQPQSGDREVKDELWRIDFVGRSLDVNNRISFYYAVSTGDAWQAVENPRWYFRTNRYVYKIQAEAYSGVGDEDDTVKRFLEDCLPTIHESLRTCR